MKELSQFDIRYSYVTDTSYLKTWLSDAKMLHWFPMQTEKEIEAAVHSWMGMSRYGASLTATLEGKPCAMGVLFLMPYKKVSHQCMVQFLVDPAYCKRGIGTSLLKNLKHLAKSYFKLELMHLEVYEGTPAVALLKKMGFREFGRQEGFVREDGTYLGRILLECDL